MDLNKECLVCYQQSEDSSNLIQVDEIFQNKFSDLIRCEVNKYLDTYKD
jgi:hypothetical protein